MTMTYYGIAELREDWKPLAFSMRLRRRVRDGPHVSADTLASSGVEISRRGVSESTPTLLIRTPATRLTVIDLSAEASPR